MRGGLLAIGLIVAGATVTAQTPPPLPPAFAFPRGEASPGAVTFSHTAHRRVEKCTTCHMRDFKMQRGGSGPITLAAKQEGKSCGACHDGTTVVGGATVFPIDACDRCHTP